VFEIRYGRRQSGRWRGGGCFKYGLRDGLTGIKADVDADVMHRLLKWRICCELEFCRN
jgi:hypothetical protein